MDIRFTKAIVALVAVLFPYSSFAEDRHGVDAYRRMDKLLSTDSCRFTAGPCDLAAGTTLNGSPIGGGSGEVNTGSNLGGGLANYSTKVGVDLRFNSFDSADFDLNTNLFTIDATKWLTIAAAALAYQPLATDLTRLVDNCVIENDGTPIPDSCVGDGSDGGGGGAGYADIVAAALAGL